MPSWRASGVRMFGPDEMVARLQLRQQAKEWVRRLTGFYEGEKDARLDNITWDMDAATTARWNTEVAGRKAELKLARQSKKGTFLYDRSFAEATMAEMELPVYQRSGSPGTSPRSGSGGFFRAKHWRPNDEPARRLNPLASQGAGAKTVTGKGMSSGTFFSRFGDAKGGMGGGVFGASASRMRSAKEFLNNPNTFFRRAAVVWIADEVGKAWTQARNWDKVSYLDTVEDADKKVGFGEEGALAGATRSAAAVVAGGALSVGTPFRRLGMALLPMTPLGLLLGYSEGQAARHEAMAEAVTDWASGGFVGPSPFAIQDKLGDATNRALADQAMEVRAKAKERFDRSIDRTIDRMQDALARRGVGSIEQVKSRYRRTPDADKALKRITAQEALKAPDASEVQKDVLNRLKQQR